MKLRRVGKGMVGQAREGTSDKTRVGRTKDDGAVTVQPKSPGHHAEQRNWGSRTRKHREAGCGRVEDGGVDSKNSQTTPATTSTTPSAPTTGRR